MGTNYYVVRNRPTVHDPIHIGKKSYGWLFCFQSQNEPWNDPPIVWSTYKQVKTWLKKHTVDEKEYVILDEYDEIVPFDEFAHSRRVRKKDESCLANPDNFKHSRNVDGYRFMDGDFW